jgi:hypothetical protein
MALTDHDRLDAVGLATLVARHELTATDAEVR